MPTSLVSTGVQFPDSTIQTTAASGGGAWTYISTSTLSGAANVTFSSGFSSSTYTAYMIEVEKLYGNVANNTLETSFAVNGGSLFSNQYTYGNYMVGSTSNTYWQEVSGFGTSKINIGQISLGGYLQNNEEQSASGVIIVYNASNSSYPMFTWNLSANRTYNIIGTGMNTGGSSLGNISQIYIAPGAGTLTGILRLYGLKKS